MWLGSSRLSLLSNSFRTVRLREPGTKCPIAFSARDRLSELTSTSDEIAPILPRSTEAGPGIDLDRVESNTGATVLKGIPERRDAG
jgi:hypothetical protein